MLAHVCEMDAGEFVHTMGDAHIYVDHIDALQQQLERQPRTFPELKIKTLPGGGLAALEKMTVDDFELLDYAPHGKISMNMSV
jgi:thymidylate synthase